MRYLLFVSGLVALGSSLAAQASNAVATSSAASETSLRAVALSAEASFMTGGSVAAIPLWMIGQTSEAVGAVSMAVGQGTTRAGEELWDLATNPDPQRPRLERIPARGVEPESSGAAPVPPPNEAFRNR